MRLKLLAVVAVGVCLLLAAPAAPAADKEDSYAKVELKGTFELSDLPPNLGGGPQVVVGEGLTSVTYYLDFSKLPEGMDRDKLKKLNGKLVVVKGKLERDLSRKLVVIVSSINDANLM